MIERAVEQLSENKIVAWMHGRMEFGPRALGNRSILASPLDPYSTENLNTYIKHREPFRKFAASVPAELADEYFEVGPNARFLATVGRVPRALSQALRKRDSGRRPDPRPHWCREEDNPLYWRLLHAAGKATGPAGALQHVVQPLRRAAGLHAARCRPKLLLVGHRRDVHRQLPAAEIRPRMWGELPGRTPISVYLRKDCFRFRLRLDSARCLAIHGQLAMVDANP